jgi:rRNA processing protein Krr1/Pno1
VTEKKEETKSDQPAVPGESLKLSIPSKYYGTLIGSGGSTLNLIQEACGVRIEIPRKNEGEIVTITGSSEGIARCKGTLESLVKTGFSSITHPGQQRNEIAVEERLRPRLVGKGACNLIALQHATNTQINLPQQGKGNKVSIVGAPDDIRRAKELIKQLLTDGYCSATHPGYVKLEMPFPSNMFGTLIGPSGGNIKHIQNSTGVMLNIPRSTDVNQNLTLIGTPESIGAAQKHINAIIEKEQREAAAARDALAEEEEYWKVDESSLEVW